MQSLQQICMNYLLFFFFILAGVSISYVTGTNLQKILYMAATTFLKAYTFT